MLIKNAEAGADLHIDFVPMVDVLFNLLIFFLIATSMVQAEREMRIALPHAASSGPITAALSESASALKRAERPVNAGPARRREAVSAEPVKATTSTNMRLGIRVADSLKPPRSMDMAEPSFGKTLLSG